jgi:GT2 family glycosyltransferase
MKISVVIPTFNRAYCIERAVDSVLNQNYKPYEIIVVDDGSLDNTRVMLHKYSDKVILINQKNKGVSGARNTGINKASGDWIALLDSDDEWLTHKLKSHIAFYKVNPLLHIFQCEEIWVRNGIRVNPRRKHKKYGGWIFEKCLPLCIVSPSAVIFKKALWQETGGFDEEFPVCEDYDFWLRIARLFPIGLDSEPGIIKYGGHNDQLSRNYPMMDVYRIKALEKHIYDRGLPKEQRALVLNEALRKLKVLLKGAQNRGQDGNIWIQKIVTFQKLKKVLQ